MGAHPEISDRINITAEWMQRWVIGVHVLGLNQGRGEGQTIHTLVHIDANSR